MFLSRYCLTLLMMLPSTGAAGAQQVPVFEIELEGGAVWQSRNQVQIPNSQSGTRFSLLDPVGSGPFPAARLYVTWNAGRRHALRALLAPLTITGTGAAQGPIAFAGETFPGGNGVEGKYRFNSWRLTYRYRAREGRDVNVWVGFTAKLRDAEVRLRQGSVTARDTDLGFVPLLHVAMEWRAASRTHLRLDVDGLAGGPGRAVDAALKLGYDVADRWAVNVGYRTLEGGADVDRVYAFAWLHYAVFSLSYRFGSPR